jgi:glycine/D-amino acid oxidase-like deaminating enzyme
VTGRIVIIGNGAIGMTAASELATRATGAEIVIIGPRNRTGGASAAAGVLGCFGELTKSSLHGRWPPKVRARPHARDVASPPRSPWKSATEPIDCVGHLCRS